MHKIHPLQVGVNLMYLRPQKVGGSETYVRQLLGALQAHSDLSLQLYCSQEVADSLGYLAHQKVVLTRKSFSTSRRLFVENVTLSRVLKRETVDVLFSPANIGAPLIGSVPQVVTIHDLQHIQLPSNFSPKEKAFRSMMFGLSFRRANTLIAISNFTRQQVLAHYRIPADRIVVIYEGATEAPAPTQAEKERLRAKYELEKSFIFYPAMSVPHKNHSVLLRALAMRKRNESRPPIQLVLSGKRTAYFERIQEMAKDLGVADEVRDVGYVSDRDMNALVTMAHALVYPSLFEGFGLPVVEAMKAGTPVIASESTATAEIAGEGALLLHPDNPEEWAHAINELTEPATHKEWANRGIARSELFSWERCAAQTAEVLKQAAAQ